MNADEIIDRLDRLIEEIGSMELERWWLVKLLIPIFAALYGVWAMDVVRRVPEKKKEKTLRHAVIPYGQTEIPDGAFYQQTELETVEIPDTVTRIGEKAFYGCTKLQTVQLPPYLEEIGENAFYNCPVDCWEIPASVRIIGACAFLHNKDWRTRYHYYFAGDAGRITIGYGAFAAFSTLRFQRCGRKFHIFLWHSWGEDDWEKTLAHFLQKPSKQSFWKITDSQNQTNLSVGYYDIDKSILRCLRRAQQKLIYPILLEQDLDTLSILLEDEVITKGCIDGFIECAIRLAQEGGSFEMQTMLMEYKRQHFGYESIEERFQL